MDIQLGKKNWINASGKPVENQPLWEMLYALAKRHSISWIKVKGHSDNEYNNRCDQLARSAIKNGV